MGRRWKRKGVVDEQVTRTHLGLQGRSQALLGDGAGEQRGLPARLRRDADEFCWGVPNSRVIVRDDIAETWDLNRLGEMSIQAVVVRLRGRRRVRVVGDD